MANKYLDNTGLSYFWTKIKDYVDALVTGVSGVKGDSETSYRTGNVNITKANIGLGNVENKSSATIRGELTKANVTDALGGYVSSVTYEIPGGSLYQESGDVDISDVGKKAIKSITRSGTTFTATRYDNTTFTFTQKDDDTTYTAATATPKNIITTTAVVGTSAKYAREDHVHVLSVATGDSNGQVKIGGANVNVSGWSSKADLASPAFTGNPTATTQAAGNSSTRIATTAFVMTAIDAAFYTKEVTIATVTTNANAYADIHSNTPSAPTGYTLLFVLFRTYNTQSVKGPITVTSDGYYLMAPPSCTMTNVVLKYYYIKSTML